MIIIKTKPLRIMLLKTSALVKFYNDETKWMNFLIKDDDLLSKYNDIWNKVSSNIKKELNMMMWVFLQKHIS